MFFCYNENMDEKEEIIAIISGNNKVFYKAVALQNNTDNTDKPPVINNGKIKEYYADLCTEKTYKNGQLQSTKNLTFINEKGAKLKNAVKTAKITANIKEGKTFTRTINQRIFYINGKKTAVLTLNEIGEVISAQGEPFNGNAKEFYPNGVLKREGYFKNALPEGEIKTYDKQGRLIAIESYKHGLRNGLSNRFTFIKDKKFTEELFFDRGILQGPRTIFTPEGKIQLREEYQDGLREGLSKLFNAQGSLEVQTSYRQGKRHGKRIVYYPDGNIMYEEDYVSGKLEGERKIFLKDSAPLCLETYSDNLLNGLRIVYDKDGKIKLKELYREGNLVKREER